MHNSNLVGRRTRQAYQELASDKNEDSLAFQGGLGIERRDGMLNCLEGKILEEGANNQYDDLSIVSNAT
jgi:hypothetical protein